MAVTLMALGNHVFEAPNLVDNDEILNFERLSRDATYTWIPQGRLNAPVAMQYTGPGQETLIIEGRAFPHWFGGLQTLANLRAAAALGKPLGLCRFFPVNSEITGQRVQGIQSQVLGDWVVTRIRTGERDIAGDGIANHVDFTIELARYGADGIVSYDAQITTQSGDAQASYGPGA